MVQSNRIDSLVLSSRLSRLGFFTEKKDNHIIYITLLDFYSIDSLAKYHAGRISALFLVGSRRCGRALIGKSSVVSSYLDPCNVNAVDSS